MSNQSNNKPYVDTSYAANLNTKPNATDPTQTATTAPAPSAVDTSYQSNLPSYTPSTTPVTSAWSGTESIDSYEDYLRNKANAYGSMKDDTVNFYDTQNQQALAAIGAQQSAANEHAKDIYDKNSTAIKDQLLADNNFAENQRKAIYNKEAQEEYETILATNNEKRQEEIKTAQNTIQDKEQLEEAIKEINSKYDDLNQKAYDSYDFGYAIDVHQQTVDAITAQMNSGMELAEETKKLLLNMSEEQRKAIYSAAENQRRQSEQNAEIERKRGVVDARSSYEQNIASYGANAESMGKMGLSGSGYGDYLTSKAYAQQRAETQNANARSETAKREARYIENQAKLDADSDYNQKKFTAEQDYANRKHDIDTTYRNNLLNADREKEKTIFDAETSEREAKHVAESTARENNLANDTTYKNNLFEADSQARADALAAQQETDAGKFAADLSYRENMLNNDDDIGAYRQQKEEEEKAKAEQHESDYYSFYDIAKSGNYSAEEIRELATKKGFSEEEIATFEKVAGDSISKSQAANNAEISEINGDYFGSIDSRVESGQLSEKDAKAQKAQYIKGGNATSAEIADAYKNGIITPEEYKTHQDKWNNEINTSVDQFKKDDGSGYLTAKDAKSHIDSIMNDPLCSEETKKALIESYNKQYAAVTNDVKFNMDIGLNFGLSNVGNNFSLWDKSGKKYRVESAGQVTDTDILDAANNVSDNEVFGCQGKIYIKKDGNVYGIQARKNSFAQSYKDLESKILEGSAKGGMTYTPPASLNFSTRSTGGRNFGLHNTQVMQFL